jgi:hypothetical protein
LRVPHFLDNRLTDGGKVVSLTRRPPFTSQEGSWHSFLLEAESTPGPQFGWKDEKFHLIGTRTRDLPACSIVPQPTTLPRAPIIIIIIIIIYFVICGVGRMLVTNIIRNLNILYLHQIGIFYGYKYVFIMQGAYTKFMLPMYTTFFSEWQEVLAILLSSLLSFFLFLQMVLQINLLPFPSKTKPFFLLF